MRTIMPEGWTRFRCLAGACRHTCCAGWEIDIDRDAADRYLRMDGPDGELVRAAMVPRADGGASFRLVGEGERCALLRDDGLCELIARRGYGALCQVCADHPRFRNWWSDRVETGFGLCCEAAVRLALTAEEPFRLTVAEDDGRREAVPEEERALRAWRDGLLLRVTDRTRPLEERAAGLCAGMPAFSAERAVARLRSLERLDPAWTALLEGFDGTDAPLPADGPWAVPMEQLLARLVYRHAAGALEDGRAAERAAFAVFSCRAVWALFRAGEQTAERLADLVRMFSAEVEYSDENVEALLADLEEATG